MTSWQNTTLNQHWNNCLYVNIGIYNIDHCQIKVFYFKIVMNNVWQRRSIVFIYNIKFDNVEQRRNNAVNITISKNNLCNIFEQQIKII